jgi:hypothetical protein
MSLRTVLAVVLVLAAGASAYFYMQGGRGLNHKYDTTDSSPIIISDGSIAFRHPKLRPGIAPVGSPPNTATVDVSGLDPHDIMRLRCAPGTAHDFSDCEYHPSKPQSGTDAIKNSEWTLVLNDGSTIHGDPRSQTVTIQSHQALSPESSNAGDGYGLAECGDGSCNLTGATLKIAGMPDKSLGCPIFSVHPKRKCVIRIRYCRNGAKCD